MILYPLSTHIINVKVDAWFFANTHTHTQSHSKDDRGQKGRKVRISMENKVDTHLSILRIYPEKYKLNT